MSDARDENLLFGILALQLDYINQSQLVDAANKWMVEKSSRLGAILVKQGAISEADCDFIRSIVDKHVARSGSPKSSLELLKQHEPIADAKEKLQTIFDGNTSADVQPINHDGTTIWIPDSSENKSRFVRLRHLASGGLGVVSVARDQELEREVALKELSDRKRTSGDAYERFVSEAKITGNLEHPGIVPIYGLGATADGSPYYAMRLIRGKSLQEEIEILHGGKRANRTPSKFSKFDAEHLRKLLRSLGMACYAVAYANSRGVIHRDLKPGNIMLGKFGETIVVDWGLAKASGAPEDSVLRSEPPVHDSRESHGSATIMGAVLGTPGYMSPEQANGWLDQVDQRSDVFGLGACLYSILTDRVPFKGNTKEESLENARSYKLARLRELDSQIPAALEAVCLKAMAAKPADRYQHATELADDIDRWIAGEAVTAMPDPLLQRVFRWARQHQTLVTSTAVLLITTIVGLSIASVLISEQRNIARQERDRANEAAEERAQEVELKKAALSKSQASVLASLQIIELFVKSLADNGWANVPQMEPARVAMVDMAVQRFNQLLEENPGDPLIQKNAVRFLIRCGNLYRMVGKLDTARERFNEAFKLIDELENDGLIKDASLALACDNLFAYVNLTEEVNGTAAAMAINNRYVELSRKRLAVDSRPAGAQLSLMMALTQRSSLSLDINHLEEAAKEAAEALSLYEEVLKSTFASQGFLPTFAITARDTEVKVLIRQGKFEAAAEKLQELVTLSEAAKLKFPDDADIRLFAAQHIETAAKLEFAKGEFDGGLVKLQAYIEHVKKLAADFPKVAGHQRAITRCQAEAGLFALKDGDISTAKEYAEIGMKQLDLSNLTVERPMVVLKNDLRILTLAHALARRDGTVPSELEDKLNSIRDKVKELDPTSAVLRETAELVQ